MTAEPGHQMASSARDQMASSARDQMASSARDRGRLRASHADREQVIDVLKVAFVQGRLDKDELEARIGQTFVARTYADLAVVTDDIPAELAPARQAREPARTGENKVAKAGPWATMAAGLIGMMSAVVGGDGNPVERLMFLGMFISLMILMVTGLLLLHSWLDRRDSGQLPPGRGPGGHGPAGQRSAGTGRCRTRPAVRTDDTRADLRAHRPLPVSGRWAAQPPRSMGPASGAA